MAMSMKQLFRPSMAYATTIRCRSQQLLLLGQPKIAFLHCPSSLRSLVKLPTLLDISGFSPIISSTFLHFKRSRKLNTTTRASSPHNVNDPGSIDSSLMQSMQNKIKDELNAESVTVLDAYGDGRHVSINVVSSAFEGQSAVNRQRMVYKAIWEELQNTVHAVDQMITRTPTEVSGDN
ncbi:Protein BOLA4 chloroplastic/mitochondrial [Bienertia sinuspersici]